ncbi:MAG: hypothetical protein ACTHN5_14305, partial [Phycisphaerae bacterium]
ASWKLMLRLDLQFSPSHLHSTLHLPIKPHNFEFNHLSAIFEPNRIASGVNVIIKMTRLLMVSIGHVATHPRFFEWAKTLPSDDTPVPSSSTSVSAPASGE